jgi:parallel beta-helix repeat protein
VAEPQLVGFGRLGVAWLLIATTIVLLPASPARADTVDLPEGANIQAAVDANPPGTIFNLAAGEYRNQQVIPKDNQQFIGQGWDTVLTGATTLTGWERRAGDWYVPGQTQQGQVHGQCEGGWSRCNRPEDLFVDGVTYRHVSSRGQLGPGSWYFDYKADRIYLGEDPAGKLIETSVTRHAFLGDADGVVIKDMVIEKYAVPAQHGAIDSRTSNIGTHGSNWTIDGVEGRLNHGGAVYLTSGGSVINSFFHHNGQQALSGTGSGLLVADNEFAFNNTAHFNLDWEGGTTKFWNTADLVFRGNDTHDNYGTGVWIDYENANSLIEYNTVSWNYREGIYVEISLSATVRNNHVEGNGLDDPRGDSWLWSGGITVASSRNVEVSGNTLINNGNGITATQQSRGSGSGGAWHVENLSVYDNDVTMYEGQTGIVQDVGDNAVFLSRNNHFEDNTYRGDGQAQLFAWSNTSHTFPEWRTQFGHDWGGRFVSSTPDTEAPALSLLGHNPMTLALHDEFIDPGARATDNFDPRSVVFSNDVVNPDLEGIYELTYLATDVNGNATIPVIRTVIVGDPLVLPEVTVTSGADAAEAGLVPGHFTITRTGDLGSPLQVHFTLSGAAETGVDYADPGSTIDMPVDEASVQVPIIPAHDVEPEGSESVTLTVDAMPDYTIGDPDVATIAIIDDDQPTAFSAVSEVTIKGTVTGGNYQTTHVADDAYEVLVEQTYAGGKRSRLEHRWTFDIGTAPSFTFTAEARRSAGVDEFAFEFSPDGATWSPLVTVTATDEDEILSSALPAGTSGVVEVRAIDTDRSRNEGQASSLFVDWMAIATN